jgi:hypothetical protein
MSQHLPANWKALFNGIGKPQQTGHIKQQYSFI